MVPMTVTHTGQEFTDPDELVRLAGSLGARIFHLVALRPVHSPVARVLMCADIFALHPAGPCMSGHVGVQSFFRLTRRVVPAGVLVLPFHTVFSTRARAQAYADDMNRLHQLYT
jgi:hypothetical protein